MQTLTRTIISTEVIQDLVGRIVNGSSLKPQLPLTCLLHLKIKDKVLTVTSTDDVNVMSASSEVTSDDIDIVVDAKQFASLIGKITTATVTLVVNDKTLTVEGNGKYDFVLNTEEDGSPISFPETYEYTDDTVNHITREQLKTILTMNKSCKSKQADGGSLFNYCADEERVLTTDTFKACNNNVKLFNSPVGIMSSTMDLVPYVSDNAGVNIVRKDNDLIFFSTKGVLIGKMTPVDELETFPKVELLESFNEKLPYECKISRSLFVAVLERLCLFTNPLDDNKLTLTFTNKDITMKVGKTDNFETLRYLHEIQGDPVEKVVDVDSVLLKDCLSSCLMENLTFKFGSDNGVQIECDSVSLLLGLLGED